MNYIQRCSKKLKHYKKRPDMAIENDLVTIASVSSTHY